MARIKDLHAYKVKAGKRLMSRLDRTEDGCWEFAGSINNKGYGQIYYLSRLNYTHRVAYDLFVGSIPEGLELDHLCRNTKCCNPAHLEAVTHTENVRRGLGNGLRERTHCSHGHSFADHAWIDRHGRRWCRVCLSHNQRAYRARLKQEATS